MPEFKFWYAGVRAIATAMAMTLVPVFDVPVFWPILLIYFIALFALTMRNQIAHMIKYRYVPFVRAARARAAARGDARIRRGFYLRPLSRALSRAPPQAWGKQKYAGKGKKGGGGKGDGEGRFDPNTIK